ncbi:hypothetical protein ABIE21_001414 [Conyzicola nivalis]|uniref:Uncharacterized protein n=1 Tax=Conyzicola nivalis TaxID=1477021 RepID=A0ABV2QLK2_9MICO
MPPRAPLPEPFDRGAFSVRDAMARGVTRDRLRSDDLQRVFHGVRATGLDPSLLVDRCRAYAPRMNPTHAFSHLTAAELYRFPLPVGRRSLQLHVTAPSPARAPGGRGIVGHQSRLWPLDVVTFRGLRVVSPVVAWCQIAETLGVDDAVAIGDWVVTGSPFQNMLPLATLDEVAAASGARSGGWGHRVREAAIPLIREGPLSRPESLLRLLLVRAGLPEPLLNAMCFTDEGEPIAVPDLAWVEFKTVAQYEGDHHRGQAQFRRDIRRDERFVDHDWTVVKATAEDLFARPRELVERFARRLRAKGWRGSIDLRHVGRFSR